MKPEIPFRNTKTAWVAVGLMAAQLSVKLALELGKAAETGNPGVIAVAVVFMFGWAAAVGLGLGGYRLGYWSGAVLGLLHFVMTAAVPMTGVCNHYVFAAVVMLHGLAIAVACLAVLVREDRKRDTPLYQGMSHNQITGFLILCAAVVVRTLWITFREPTGVSLAQAAAAGKGGLVELAAASLPYVVVPSMVALCMIIPGIVMKRRWAFTAAAVFGGIHAVLTLPNVLLGVNTGIGPAVVIPASLGMLIGGLWMGKWDSHK